MKQSNLQTMDLLYLEDDKDTREEVSLFLKSRVKNLYVACDGEEGYALYSSKKPDIILTDINMPKINGVKFSEKIRSENSDIPIIIISAYNTSEYLYKAIDLGITSFINKPLNLKKLNYILVELSKKINLEKENISMKNILKQYKNILDIKGLVSKSDKNGYITYVNQPFIDITGYSKDELIGAKHALLRDPDTPKKFYDDLWNTISIKKTFWQGRMKNRKKNGEEYYVDIVIQPILDLDGNVVEYISVRHDITDLEKTKRFLEHKNKK